VTARPASRGITGFSAKHVYHLINEGKFPAPIKIGRASLWRLSDVNSWLESHSSSNDGEA
ncbi:MULTISPECIES: helix-turn-helix transcriptional regulator, partial [unclassified Psychrobacter]